MTVHENSPKNTFRTDFRPIISQHCSLSPRHRQSIPTLLHGIPVYKFGEVDIGSMVDISACAHVYQVGPIDVQ